MCRKKNTAVRRRIRKETVLTLQGIMEEVTFLFRSET
jgi:hypothetical protein